MRPFTMTLALTLALASSASAQLRPMAGTEIWLSGKLFCPGKDAPAVQVGDLVLSALIDSPPEGAAIVSASLENASERDRERALRVLLPATLEPGTYPVKLRCGADPDSLPQIAVIDVQALRPVVESVARKDAKNPLGVALGDALIFQVRDLAPWKRIGDNEKLPLHLFLDGAELANVVATPISEDGSRVKVTLAADHLDEKVRKAWVGVLNAARESGGAAMTASLGPAGGVQFSSSATLGIDVYPSYTWAAVAFLGALVLALVVLGKRSSLLRDSSGAENASYSLAKHQMAAWFLVVIGAYLFVWMITGSFSSISTTALILIGISGATGLAAVTLDQSKREARRQQRQALELERKEIEGLLRESEPRVRTAGLAITAEASALLDSIQKKRARLEQVQAELLRMDALLPSENRSWYLDLLSDEHGVSLHRLQMAVWTVVLMAVFIRAVHTDLLMPEFDATLLGLMGISSGAYIGFKLPERVH
jgi:hypothetical protein